MNDLLNKLILYVRSNGWLILATCVVFFYCRRKLLGWKGRITDYMTSRNEVLEKDKNRIRRLQIEKYERSRSESKAIEEEKEREKKEKASTTSEVIPTQCLLHNPSPPSISDDKNEGPSPKGGRKFGGLSSTPSTSSTSSSSGYNHLLGLNGGTLYTLAVLIKIMRTPITAFSRKALYFSPS